MARTLESLDYVVIVVHDVEASVQFYRDVLGLKLRRRAREYAQFETGTTRLGLFSDDAMARTLDRRLATKRTGERFELGFIVENCDEAYASLAEAGVSLVAPPKTRPWGQRTAYVADPDGNLIELVQSADPAVDVT